MTLVQAQSWKSIEGKIMSQWAKTVNPENAWQVYPRPQFKRAHWKNLNGLWDYAILKSNQTSQSNIRENLVPLVLNSSVLDRKKINPEDKMAQKKFELPKN